MKTIGILAFGLLLICCFTFAQNDSATTSRPKTKREYPATGMAVSELEKAIPEIKALLPGDSVHILWINIRDLNNIEIDTGRVDGPRSGRGVRFEFQKIDGKWTKTGEGPWVS